MFLVKQLLSENISSFLMLIDFFRNIEVTSAEYHNHNNHWVIDSGKEGDLTKLQLLSSSILLQSSLFLELHFSSLPM